MHFSIQQRFSIWAGLSLLSVVLMTALMGVWQFDKIKQSLSSHSYEVTRGQVEAYLQVLARDTSVELSMPLVSAMQTVQANAAALQAVIQAGNNENRRALALAMLEQTLVENADYLGAYVAFEPNAIDGADAQSKQARGSDDMGRFMPYVTRNGSGFLVALLAGLEDTRRDENDVRVGEYYLCSKESGKSCVIDPYLYPVENEQVLLTSLVAPIQQGGKFIGISGVDISATFLQSVINEVAEGLYNGQGRTLLVSPRGVISGHSQHPDLIGQNLDVLEAPIREKLRQAAASGNTQILNTGGQFIVLKPFQLPGHSQHWVAYLEVPEDIVMADIAVQEQFLDKAQQRFITTTTLLGLGLALLGVATIWWVARKSIRPLKEMTDLVASIAEGEGDLTRRLNITYRDETGKLSALLNTFIEKLRNLVQQLLPVAGEVSSLSAEGRQISVETSVQMLDQENLIEEMVAAVTEMATSAQQIAVNAERTSQLVQRVNDAAAAGAGLAQKKVTSINSVRNSVVQSEAALIELGKNSQSIAETLSVIESIIQQANVLAETAEKQAAADGNGKKGVVVMAEEIRALASRTRQATITIHDKLSSLQKGNQDVLTAMQLSNQHVVETVELAQQAEVELDDISKAIEEVTEMTMEIASATEEQSAVCEDVSHNLTQVFELVQQTSKGAQQLRLVGNKLDEAANQLQSRLSVFKV